MIEHRILPIDKPYFCLFHCLRRESFRPRGRFRFNPLLAVKRSACLCGPHWYTPKVEWHGASVTRFGEIWSLMQNLQSVGQFFEGLVKFWTYFGKFCKPLGKFSLM